MEINTERISYIMPHLYIGNWKSAVYASVPKRLGIKEKIDVVISALTEYEYEEYDLTDEDFEDITWYRFVLDDYILEDIYEYFERVHDIIKESIQNGKTVLVHCAAGMSRSSTLVASYLLMDGKFETVEDTIQFLKSRRPIIQPNMGFERQLEDLEADIKKGFVY